MDDRDLAQDQRMPLSEDEQGIQRAGRGERFTGRYENYSGGGVSATLDASYYKGSGARNGKEREFMAIENELGDGKQKRKYIVRRFMPVECTRLQGLPGWWCDGANGSDSAIYKMDGNAIAVPCGVYVLGKIADELRKEESE